MREEQFDAALADWSSPAPHPRLWIYRNNVASALAGALAVRYPVVEQLVGSEFFAAMAQAYAAAERPDSPVLIHYGAGFPGFIEGFSPAASVPYLADVARLESLWWQAYHAADATPADATIFAQLPPERLGDIRLAFHPSCGFLAARFAAGSVWQAHHGGPTLGQFAIDRGELLLVVRPQQEVRIHVLPQTTFDFLMALSAGAPLADAVEQADTNAGFDLASQIRSLFALGLVTGFRS